MAGISERLFRRCPRPLKDVLCTAYGLRIHHQRYGGDRAGRLARLAAEAAMSREDLQRLSTDRLRSTLVYAARDVPYYRRLFAREGIDPRRLPLPEGLAAIPILEKETVRSRPEEFLSRSVSPASLITRETSGTTGSPLRVKADLASLRLHYAYYERFRRWAGTAVGRRRATFNGRVLWPASRRRPPFWVRDLSENNLLFSIYHMSPTTLHGYVRKLVRYRPEELHAYPSALITLARFAREEGLPLPRPGVILLSAETLHQMDRDFLQESFKCPVYSQYGNAEMSIFAADCLQGRLHLVSSYGHLELLNARPGEDGTTVGEAITSGFINRAMPLIRYRVGDTVSLSSAPCECGLAYPVIREVVGRTDDLLLLPDGRVVGRLDPVFKGLAGLREVQIVQEAADLVVLRVVPATGYGEKAEKALISALGDRLGPSVRIQVRLLPSIPRTDRGKFQAVVRRFNPSHQGVPQPD